MIWIPEKSVSYLTTLRSSVRKLVWQGNSVDIRLARYAGIYATHDRHLARLQAVFTTCLRAPLPTNILLHMNEPQPETIMFHKWIDDYDLDS